MGLLEIAIAVVGWFAFATLVVACATAAGRADRRERRMAAETVESPVAPRPVARERRRVPARAAAYYGGRERRVRSGMRPAH